MKQFVVITLIIGLSIFAGCIPSSPASTEQMSGEEKLDVSAVPIALQTGNSENIKFECVNEVTCIPDLNLEKYSQPRGFQYSGVYYVDFASIFVLQQAYEPLLGKWRVVHVNLITDESQALDLPAEITDPIRIVIDGMLVISERNGSRIYIVQNNMNITEIYIDTSVDWFIGTDTGQIIALNRTPKEEGGKKYVEVAVIDLALGVSTKKMIALPEFASLGPETERQATERYLFEVVGVSTDLENLYIAYTVGDPPQPVLGMFDVETLAEQKTITDPNLLNFTRGYVQYRDVLYSGNRDGHGKATLIDMVNLVPIHDFGVETEIPGQGIHIVPFGNAFLIGTGHEIFVLDATGVIIEHYPLPDKWIARDYILIRYGE